MGGDQHLATWYHMHLFCRKVYGFMASIPTPDPPRSPETKLRMPPLAPFRSRDFSLLWFGSFVSQAGSQMHVVAVSWQVYELTKDPLALGAIGVARIVPLVLLALGSGVLADA